MMSDFETNGNFNITIEDEVNARRGYTATLGNPKVSKEAKHNALDLLNNELGDGIPPHYLNEALEDRNETPSSMNTSFTRSAKVSRFKTEQEEP